MVFVLKENYSIRAVSQSVEPALAGAGLEKILLTRSDILAPLDTQYSTRSRFSSMLAGLVRGLYVPTTSTGRPLRARSFSITTTR
jgi:hypothetical protein